MYRNTRLSGIPSLLRGDGRSRSRAIGPSGRAGVQACRLGWIDRQRSRSVADGWTATGCTTVGAGRCRRSCGGRSRRWLWGLVAAVFDAGCRVGIRAMGARGIGAGAGVLAAVVFVSCVGRSVARDNRDVPQQLCNASCCADSSDSQTSDLSTVSSAIDESEAGCWPGAEYLCNTEGWVRSGTTMGTGAVRSGVRGRGCRTAPECKEKGWCAGHLPGECYEATDDSCRKSFYCEYEGLCVRSGQTCEVAVATDCEMSIVCRVSGQCSLGDGRCIATSDEQCRRSENCRTNGRCARAGEMCEAGDSWECRQAKICASHGRCHAIDRGCFALNRDDCDTVCRKYGRCHWERGTCVVRSDADCEASDECKSLAHRRCKLLEGKCVTAGAVDGYRFFQEYGERMRL